MILTGFLVAPRVPFTTAAAVIEGNGRRGREAGNDGFRMGRGRADCRDGEVGEASGDETRGRFVLIASDMGILVGYGCGMNRNDRYESAVRPEESGDIRVAMYVSRGRQRGKRKRVGQGSASL
jgi:hypothetical protein